MWGCWKKKETLLAFSTSFEISFDTKYMSLALDLDTATSARAIAFELA